MLNFLDTEFTNLVNPQLISIGMVAENDAKLYLESADWTALGPVDIPSLGFEHRRKSMSTQRFTPEFKEEAVRQVLERGYSVAEIGARVGVSTNSLYKWGKAVTPPKDEKQAAELIEAKSEILRLHAQMRRLEEERDLLKKALKAFNV